MGEEAGFTKPDEKITLASYVTYMPTELNLTLAFYNIARVPKFWLERVLKRDFGARTVAMKQYPLTGALISIAGLIKKVVHGVMRRDVSAIPRPLDLTAGKLFVRRSKRARLAKPSAAFEHCLPYPTEAFSERVAPRKTAHNAAALRVL